jgi:redox-sensitive bicupin YhaK (pirin superfamily)
MSAGSGVTHSEFNHAPDQTTHFLQIWIEPNVSEIVPSYEQKSISAVDKQGKLCLIASTDGAGNAVKIHADAKVYAGLFDGPQSQTLTLDPKRKAYVHLVQGQLHVNGILLSAGDALLVENESSLLISAGKDSEVLVFDLSQA